ncbi:hypothetical protein K2X40_03570 [Candidatus Babeliales bacterium]|nr:hypothetical protein [Candidatus Babeliales bacterium]
MVRRVRISVILLGALLFFWWAFLLFARHSTADSHFYSRNAYNQDTCKIYCDLGLLAQNRNDYKQAVRYYKVALSFRPDSRKVCNQLDACYQLRNKPVKAALALQGKLIKKKQTTAV